MARTDIRVWVRAAKQGDGAATTRIYEYLRIYLLPFIQRSTPPHIDPEDILDETFLRVWQGLWRLRDDNSLLSFATKIAERIVSHQRGERRFVPIFERAECDVAAGNIEAEEFLAQLLESLTVSELRLFGSLYAQGATRQEIGLKLRISAATLSLRKHRLDTKLRRIVRRLRQ